MPTEEKEGTGEATLGRMDRRRFLKMAGLGAGSLAVLALGS